ncbi:asparagine synthase (glutamine-hydrolyzing) [candidate division KSB1 bacterium]|nr:asparagine synthase (glutamine-hydrolyzing) [candidate division KSB1 bacterium]
MCGIYGFTTAGKNESRALLDRMGEVLFHRGPDGCGAYIDDHMALGHRRLSIIDLNSGAQPMEDWLGRYVVSFNGEIYNFQELRAQLKSAGFRFRTRSDTEVILAAYAIYGEECVRHFQGMFAFALWDKKERTLMLGRDRVGKKPLYYYHKGDQFVFASEIKAILAMGAIARDWDAEALNEYLTFGYIHAPMTIFKNIRQVGEAHILVYKDNQCQERQYWTLPEPGSDGQTEEESVANLEILLQKAVDSRLISDVPLGAFLSGGIDSSAVVAMMARSSAHVNTFTIDFAEKTFSELEDARSVSRHCATNHKILQVSTDSVAVLPQIAWHFDEPFADSSAIPTYYVSKMAREHVTVILSGDGGDELFAGYRNYFNRDKYELFFALPYGLRKNIAGAVAGLLPIQAPMRNMLKYIASVPQDEGQGAPGFYPYIKEDILDPHMLHEFRASDPMRSRRDLVMQYKNHDKLTRMQLIDLQYYLPGDILVKVDRMSMANSLETRAPLLDYRLIEFATTLPVDYKMKDGVSKHILKQVLKKYVPEHILKKSKQGFAIPVGKWFKSSLNSYVKEMLLDDRSKARGIFKPAVVENVLDLHTKGRRDFGEWIYMLLMLELWFQTFMDPQTRRI